jgi:hypothetical protein
MITMRVGCKPLEDAAPMTKETPNAEYSIHVGGFEARTRCEKLFVARL